MNQPQARPDLGFIHRFIAGANPARPPLLVLHGSGGDENDLLPFVERIAPGHTMLSPRGKTNEQGITRFFRRDEDGTWDLNDLKHATLDLSGFVRRACAAYKIGKPIAFGYSNGANIAWSLMLRDPEILSGAILLRSMAPFDPRPLPDLSGVPILLIAADYDELIPVERAGLLAALLGEAGANVTYEVLHAGHGLTGEDIKLCAEWLAARR